MKVFKTPFILLLIAIAIVTTSIIFDWNKCSWVWFQRSGSLLVLIGAIMEARSIIRLGIKGVGGVNTTILMGNIGKVIDQRHVLIEYTRIIHLKKSIKKAA